jgi:hypothetical protein
MRFLTFILFSVLSAAYLQAQNSFIGSYEGIYNNDKIYLTLNSTSGNILTGNMNDSQQKYVVKATANGNSIKGTAVESSLGLTFNLVGTLNGSQLPLKMTLNAGGQTVTLDVNFVKKGVSSNVSSATPPQYTKAKLPSGATNDPNLVGKWTKNEYYNSGYGDNAFGGSFSQSMVFMVDGSLSDGGSRASVSGSTYSGSSQGGAQALPNVIWYNINNQLYLQATENGQIQTVHLGKYYIENGKLLITGKNGQKLFLTKQ